MFHKVLKAIKYVILRIKIAIPIIKLFPGYIRDSIRQKTVRLGKSKKKVFFTFDDRLFRPDDNDGREPYYVMQAFSDGGYDVYFYRRTDFRNYYRLHLCGRPIYKIKNLKFVSRLPENTQDFIYGFDSIRPDFLRREWKKLVYFNIRKAATYQIGNVISMPFGMFPLVYASGADRNLGDDRNLTRKCRIFFGGNVELIYYDSPIFKIQYPQFMTRLEGVRAIVESGLDILFIKDNRGLKEFLNNSGYLSQMVIVQAACFSKIRPSQWLKIVGQSDFFMCFSGASYPICHNAIEAMAVGSIPIIAYAGWFDPQLEHGKNAIVYSGKEDLIEKIKEVLRMPQEEIRRLRKGVEEYYDNYLARGCLARKYEANAKAVSTLMLFPRLVSDPTEEEKGRSCVQKFEEVLGLIKKCDNFR